jgi:hypothetical protein
VGDSSRPRSNRLIGVYSAACRETTTVCIGADVAAIVDAAIAESPAVEGYYGQYNHPLRNYPRSDRSESFMPAFL